ncbi:MAG: histidine triad nucleotide-binding protein [bacterium]|nr:histidine triad nucleotide-binding protein [bacterium]
MASCLFCDIAAGEIPATQVHADEDFVAFRDIDPKAPTHVLVIPRRHVTGLDRLGDDDVDLVGRLLVTATRIASAEGLTGGYRFVINCGDDGGQTVHHLHLHILGGRAMKWPPG